MQSIGFYTDYRKFLSDYYNNKKKATCSTFSYRNFSKRAGLKSPSVFREVSAGKRNLTPAGIDAFVKGLRLSEGDARFFENLVLFNQAKTEDARKKYLAILRGLRYHKPQKLIPVHLYEYYEKWYNPVIRELAVALDWQGNYSMLAKAVVPPIKVSQARESVATLLRLGFILKNSDGSYRHADQHITTGPEVNSLAVRQMNRNFARLGIEALDRFPPHERDISSLVMGVPREKLPLIKQEIAEFRKKCIAIADSTGKADRFYTLVMELFPVGHTVSGQERRHE
jgi:uncharacterized protein (TIGR02147 family)